MQKSGGFENIVSANNYSRLAYLSIDLTINSTGTEAVEFVRFFSAYTGLLKYHEIPITTNGMAFKHKFKIKGKDTHSSEFIILNETFELRY